MHQKMRFPAWNQMMCKSEINWFNLYLYTKSFLCHFQLESHEEAFGRYVYTVSTESMCQLKASVLANTAMLHSTLIWHFKAFSAPQIVHIATARSPQMLLEWLIHWGKSAQITNCHLQEGKHNLRNKTSQ